MQKFNFSKRQKKFALMRWEANDFNTLKSITTGKSERSLLKIRIIAYLQGDGSVSIRTEPRSKKVHYDIAFYPDNYKVARIFVDSYKKVYGKTLNIEPLENHFRVRVGHRLACKDLLSITTFDSLRWKIPFELMNVSSKKREWIRAFFDCEAYVGKSTIVVQSVNKSGLNQVRLLLHEFAVDCKVYEYHRKQKHWNTNHLLVISNQISRHNFLKRVGFNHPLKQHKLEVMCRRGLTW